MQPTAHPHVNHLLSHLLAQMQTILSDRLVGLYLYGSLVTDDYDEHSDVDLLAALAGDMNEVEFDGLNTMQDDLVLQDTQWQSRIEIAYLSRDALQTFKTQRSKLAIISPGEPFHIIEAGSDWLVNWYVVREQGVTLFGPPPETLIAPISQAEFIQTVKTHVAAWRDWINEMRDLPGQSYAILTLCRGLYTIKHGAQVSKRQAALWAGEALPQWSPLIKNAVLWRQGTRAVDDDPAAMMADTRRFVHFVADEASTE